jgi:hypothetical protein
MIELNKRFTLMTAPGVISLEGAKLIHELIQAQRITTSEDWQKLNPTYKQWWLPALPDDFQWQWVITTGDNQGTFPRRVSRYYFKTYGLKCPDSFLREVGNIARAHSSGDEVESFDFDNQFDWNDGDFSDGGSCYWWNGRAGLEALRDNKFFAIRFYIAADSNVGIARAWVYPMSLDNSLFIIFNGYGYTSLTIAQIFARFMGLNYKRIGLSNNYSTTGVIYINHDMGYIIGATDKIERYRDYDFEIDVDDFTVCESCNRHLHEDDVYYSPYGEPYCENCFDEYYIRCYRCGETYRHDDITYVESTGQDLCEHCLERNYSYCNSCDGYYKHDQMHEHDGELFCWQCLNDATSPPEWAE